MSTIAAVVVNYNYSTFVRDAVQSVLDQSEAFDEIIVVDDGSTDDSITVLSQMNGPFRLIEKKNGGQLSAVWTGVEACRSDYVYVLDSDDMATAKLVEIVRPHLESTPIKLQFQLRAVDESGGATESVFPSYPAEYSASRMKTDNALLGFYVCAPTSGNVFRREFLRDLAHSGILEERGAFVDGAPAQVAPYFGEIRSLNQALALYRVHGGSDSQWGRPTVALLEREVAEYRRRWQEVGKLLGTRDEEVPSFANTAYTMERRLMQLALQGRRPPIRLALTYGRAVRRSALPLRQRLILAVWSVLLAVSPEPVRRRLVVSRRSPGRRGFLLRVVAGLARVRSRPAE